ncbi:MAG: DUF393 domain-containing protein, partial [Planctomycetales bacterium]|nr:DUF393 domain-containing protein [Planctomycetales bacterium]
AMPDETCLSALQLALPDGRVFAGADAFPRVLRRLGFGWRALGALLGLRAARPLARVAYRWIAVRRQAISCRLDRTGGSQAGVAEGRKDG